MTDGFVNRYLKRNHVLTRSVMQRSLGWSASDGAFNSASELKGPQLHIHYGSPSEEVVLA
jgi:hypothetical protein